MPFPSSEFVQNGRFTDVEQIGQGAYGKVYYARDNMDREVAVKEVLPSSEAFGEARVRFEKEARIQASLDHPNIIHVYHLETDSVTGEWYLICEYANARSLADYLEEHGKLPEEMAIKIAQDVCNALAEIWDRGIVHRDIKPSNILLTRNANGEITAKLSDFGVAQDQHSARTTMAQGVSHPGTPLYMAPEQSSSANVLDARADIYALGITLWEMVTAQDYKPLLGQTTKPDLRKYNPNASRRIAKVIQAAVQTDRLVRYQAPTDMAQDLKAVQHRKEPRIAMKRRNNQPQEDHYARRKWLWGLLTLVVLVLLGGWAFIMSGSDLSGVIRTIGLGPTPTSTPVPPTATATVTPEPPTLTPTPANICQVPNLAGSDRSAAEGLLTELGLQPIRSLEFHPTVPEGQVIRQDPEAGTRLNPCEGEITFIISRGAEPTVTVVPTETPTSTPEPEPELEPEPEPETETEPEPDVIAGAFEPFRDEFNTTLRSEWRITSPGLSISQAVLRGRYGTLVYDQHGSDYVIRTRVAGRGYFGIMFRRTPNLNQGYNFVCGQNDCVWEVVTDGNYRKISSSISRTAAFNSNNFHDLAIEIRGRDFMALVDGQLFSSVTDETYTEGVVGFFVNDGYGYEVSFDYFELAPLP